MGDVYLAEDTRLGRQVALKSPAEAWLQAPDARARLQREARAAARLNHPSIAAIYDVLDVHGQPFIVIEYVEGEPLSESIRRNEVPVERAVEIARQLADALAAAHAAGVVHRDLKPANVMVTSGGRVKVLDFGLARTSGAADPGLTDAGQVLGTPGYMAPEQLVGGVADERSDIYSLGALLFEMLTGDVPVSEPDPVGRAIAALTSPPPSARARNPVVPPAVDAVLARALARDPKERFRSAEEFKAALDGVAQQLSSASTQPMPTAVFRMARPWQGHAAMIVAALLLAAVVGGVSLAKRWTATAPGAVPVVAVMPLENRTADPANAYLGAAFADALITGLAGVRALASVARVGTEDPESARGSAARVARMLDASYVVEGSVQRAGSSLKVHVRLVKADGSIPWAEDFEDSMSHVFDLQRRLAVGVTHGLQVALSPADRQRLSAPPTTDILAWREYSEGRNALDTLTREGALDAAVTRFREAIARDDRFALAYAGLGDALWQRYRERRVKEDADRAIAATERARSLDPENPLVRLSLAGSYLGTGKYDAALAELQAALSMQPNNDEVHRMLGTAYARLGRTDDAIAHAQKAVALRPNYWRNYVAIGALYYRAGRLDDAADAYRKVTELQPDNSWGFLNLGSVHYSAGHIDEAIENYRRSIAITPSADAYSNLGAIFHGQGRFNDAIQAYEEAVKLSPADPLIRRNLGDARTRLGHTAAARAEYERAIELGERMLAVNPADAGALSLTAVCTAKLGRFDAARALARRALDLAPEQPQVVFRAAAIEALAGDEAAALDLLERAVRAGFSPALIRIDDDFARLRGRERFQQLTADAR